MTDEPVPATEAQLEAARARLTPLLSPGMTLPIPAARIQIDKLGRRATLLAGDREIKSYPIVLGFTPEGHKLMSGDGRTPEGDYFICTRLAKSKFHLFLGLNYPNAADAERAVAAGNITAGERQTFVEAQNQKLPPSWRTGLGGAIGLHGGGTSGDWTAGCIAFNDDAIEEIWVATDYWTPVTIR